MTHPGSSQNERLLLRLFTVLLQISLVCAQLYTCSFETDFCRMKQETGDNFDWNRTDKPTTSSDTGPDKASDGKFYIYIEASDPRKNGDKAIISTPKLDYAGPACVHFSYHMFGTNMNGNPKAYLSVYIKKISPIFKVEGQIQDKAKSPWVHIKEDITLTKTQKIYIEAARGSGAFSDVSVDNVKVIAGTCANPITHPVTTTTTPATTTTTTPMPTFEPTTTCPDPLQISFETGKVTECKIRQVTDDDFDWDIINTTTKSEETGPTAAYQGTYFIYTEASHPRKKGETARLILQSPVRSGKICLSFMYFMYGYHMGKLEFYVIKRPRIQVMPWCMVGQQQFKESDKWRKAVVDIDMGVTREMGFIGTIGDGYAGDIAIDDIKFSAGECNGVLWQCSFETAENSATMCGIEQDTTDDFDWELMKGETPSDDTGPRKARTGLYYIFIEASTPRKKNDDAIIYLPVNTAGPVCISFDVCMKGFHTGGIFLFAKRKNTIIDYWNRTGEWDHRFHAVSRTLTELKRWDKIGFRGVRGNAFSGDIALDTIKVVPGECP